MSIEPNRDMQMMDSNEAIVEKVAAAVLYEGHMLYPYRPSLKNLQRWTFGCVFPPAYSGTHENENAAMQTECLVEGTGQTAIDVKVRFLHLRDRRVSGLSPQAADGEPEFVIVESFSIGEKQYHSWQEVVERSVSLAGLRLGEIEKHADRQEFTFPASRNVESLRDPVDQRVVGRIEIEQQPLAGSVCVDATRVDDHHYRLTVSIENETPLQNPDCPRDEALLGAFVSTHTILTARLGAFVSSIDPPGPHRAAVSECCNRGTWPVLVGEEGHRGTMLSAPIILYDYPQVAPESPGDMFDATEIDEILSLRILTLTDDEKRQMLSVEQQTRALLERTEALDRDALMRLHGTIRNRGSVKGGLE